MRFLFTAFVLVGEIWDLGVLLGAGLQEGFHRADESGIAPSSACASALFLVNMELAWWEALGLFVLFLIQLADTGGRVRVYVTWIYFAWCGVEVLRLIGGNRKAAALGHFREILWQACKEK